jgi:hypothetical protein
MGPGIVFLIPLYFILVSFLGYVVLRFVERGDRTFTNVGIFVVGATLGMFGLPNFAIRILIRIFAFCKYEPAQAVEEPLIWLLALGGLLLGGIAALRIRNNLYSKYSGGVKSR